MRLLHTGDWHVGKLIRGRSRADEHRAVLDEIVTIADREAVDLVLVAGDLFETSAPAPESEEIVYRALLRLAADGRTVAVVAGNHDNPRRLRAVAPLLDLGAVHVVAEPSRPDEGGIVRFTAGDEPVAVVMVPFVSQRGIVRAEDLLSGGTDERSPKYAQRVRRVIDALCDSLPADGVCLVLAHLMVAGGVMGGGERDAHTIFEYSVPSTSFPPSVQYVALGHLHRAQQLPGAAPVRYAGSPLQLDFGETANAPSVTIVDAAPGAPASVREVPIESGRRLNAVEGTLDELEALVDSTGDDWLRIRVHDQVVAGLGDQVRAWFPHAVDVQVVRPDDGPGSGVRTRRQGRSPVDLFDEYLVEQAIDDPRVRELFVRLLDEVG